MKLAKIRKFIFVELFILVLLLGIYLKDFFCKSSEPLSASSNQLYRIVSEETDTCVPDSEEKDYIKWVDFNVTKEAMQDAYNYDVDTYGEDVHLDWISLLAYQACKNGGDFSQYKCGDISEVADKLISKEKTLDELTADMKYYTYYYEAYDAVLGGLVGEYEIEIPSEDSSINSEKKFEKRYGLKGFLPIAKNFPYSDYDDFGVSRSYGYKRHHLGHDMMGQIGTPI